jgi:predicted Zn-dependent peptidase
LLIFGRIIPVAEIVARLDEVDRAAVARVARRLFSAEPTFAALGPIGEIEDFDRIARRLRP